VTREAIYLVYNDDVKETGTRVCQHLLKGRATRIFLAESPLGVQLHQAPPLTLNIILDVGGLGIQAVSIHLFTHGDTAITHCAEGLDVFEVRATLFDIAAPLQVRAVTVLEVNCFVKVGANVTMAVRKRKTPNRWTYDSKPFAQRLEELLRGAQRELARGLAAIRSRSPGSRAIYS